MRPKRPELEARLVAQRVRRLLDEGFPVTDKQTGELRPVTAGDIVILLRSPKGKARTYIAALERVGVTATAEQRGGLLETNEVGTIVSLLNVIDNPRQDVDLIGVMLSPLFGFSEEELAEIRLTDRTAGFYDALLLARETMPKAESFVQKLDYLRAFACNQPVYRLLWEIYDRTAHSACTARCPAAHSARATCSRFSSGRARSRSRAFAVCTAS